MKTLIITKNMQWFWNRMREDFSSGDIFKIYRNQGRVILNDGNELIYISSNKSLRGYRGVDVKTWSIPDWYNEETEALIKHARMP